MLRSCATSFTYPLTRNPVLGRGFANILDPKLSRQHVRLEDATDGYSVIPLGRNGVGLGGGAVLKPGDEPGFLRLDEEISLLPGSDHRFVLAALPEADPAEPESKRQRSGEEDVAVQAASLSDGAATSSSGSAAGGSGGGGGGGASAGGGGGASDSDDDWTSVPLPPFAQPPKPSAPAGLDALARLAMQPESADARNIFLLTRELVVAYDLYPKGRVHLLILPRARRIDWPEKLAAEDAALVRKCARLGRFLASRLRERTPELAPFVMGFHAVPSMRQLCAPRACLLRGLESNPPWHAAGRPLSQVWTHPHPLGLRVRAAGTCTSSRPIWTRTRSRTRSIGTPLRRDSSSRPTR